MPRLAAARDGSEKYLVSEVRIAVLERRFGFQARHFLNYKSYFFKGRYYIL